MDKLGIRCGILLVPALMSAGCAHTGSLSGGAADIPTPGICGDWAHDEGPGALVAAFAGAAGLAGGEAFLVAGDALLLAGEQAAPGGEFEYFMDEAGCVELVQFLRVVEVVSDPAREIALEEARALRPRTAPGLEVGLAVHVGLSPTGERALTGQSLAVSGDRRQLSAQLAEGLSVIPAAARPR